MTLPLQMTQVDDDYWTDEEGKYAIQKVKRKARGGISWSFIVTNLSSARKPEGKWWSA